MCNVHANLFKGAVADVEVADVDHPGHPVAIFKQENLALRAAMLRIRRILSNYAQPENADFHDQLIKGLKRQFELLGQFQIHYNRKEKLFFPIMERYGHDAPPKVMWGVDDDIRQLFKKAKVLVEQLPEVSIEEVSVAFEVFAQEFEEMIFKEESILIMILLETFSQDDWLQIAKESSAYGYAIIKPSEVWQPHRESFDQTDQGPGREVDTEPVASLELTSDRAETARLDTPHGSFTISYEPKQAAALDPKATLPMGNGYLSMEQANLILNNLPLEITFVNKDDIFQYYNDSVPAQEMIFKRTPSQIGRHVDLCHPPKLLDKVRKIFGLLRSGQRDKVDMWFKSKSKGKFVYVTYAAVRDEQGDFQGVLEYVQDIQPFRDIETDFNREI